MLYFLNNFLTKSVVSIVVWKMREPTNVDDRKRKLDWKQSYKYSSLIKIQILIWFRFLWGNEYLGSYLLLIIVSTELFENINPVYF